MPDAPTLETLRVVIAHHAAAIPFESIDPFLGRPVPIDLPALTDKLVRRRRGGYCFELNSVLGWMLEELGFVVARHQGNVGLRERLDPPPPVNHLALTVALEEGTFLADAGLGEGQIDATPLVAGTHGGPLTMTVEPEDGGWFLGHHPWGAFEGVRVAAPVVALDAFQPHHRRLATHPESKFVNTLIVQRPYRDRIETLRSRTLTVAGPDVDERRVLADAEDLAVTLRDRFGIDPEVLGEAAIAQLWARAGEQHERWQQTQAAQTR